MVNVFHVAFASMALLSAANSLTDQARARKLQVVDFRDEILDEVNKVRKEKGLDEVCTNNKLMDAAQIQANDMAENNFIKSTGSDGSSPKDRAILQGFTADTVTETVGAGYRTATSVIAAWTKSATADSTIFSTEATVLGAGYVFDKTRKFVHFWAVDFSTGECGDGPATNGTAGAGGGTTTLGTDETEFHGGSGSNSDPATDNDDTVLAPASGPATDSGAVTPSANTTPTSRGAGTPPIGNTPPVTPSSVRAPELDGTATEPPIQTENESRAAAPAVAPENTRVTTTAGDAPPATPGSEEPSGDPLLDGSGAPPATPLPSV